MTFEAAALFDAARLALSQVVKPGGSIEPLNETETRTHLIDPVLVALGYRSLDNIRREYRLTVSGQVVDYLLTAGDQRVVVEAKPVTSELVAKDGGQLVGYSAQEGIRWALLTNGLVWKIFDIEAAGNWEMKLVAEVNVGRAFRNETLAEALIPLAHFALDVLKVDDSALRAFAHEERVRSNLDRLLRDANSSVVRAVVAEMARVGIDVDGDEVVALLRKGTVAPTKPVSLSEASVPPKTGATIAFYVFPAGPDAGYSGLEQLKFWLKAGFWGVRTSTAHRTGLKTDDLCCFYATGVGVVARAAITAPASVTVSQAEWPGPGPFHEGVYKVRLRDIVWLAAPVEISRPLRRSLDAFKGKDLDRPWSWFIQSTSHLTEHDFWLIVGGPG